MWPMGVELWIEGAGAGRFGRAGVGGRGRERLAKRPAARALVACLFVLCASGRGSHGLGMRIACVPVSVCLSVGLARACGRADGGRAALPGLFSGRFDCLNLSARSQRRAMDSFAWRPLSRCTTSADCRVVTNPYWSFSTLGMQGCEKGGSCNLFEFFQKKKLWLV